MNILLVLHSLIAVLLIITVLLQRSSGGLGSAFGGGSSYHTKRGLEKSVFYSTIVLAGLFTATSLLIVY